MIRLGVIGFGSMGQWMTEAFAMVPEVQLVGVADVSSNHLRAASALGLQVFPDFQKLLEQPLDGVYIATPNNLHKTHVLAAAERRIPIFIEKPIALTLSDIKEMIVAVEKAGIPVLVNFSYRFSPPYERLRLLLEAGVLGDLLACWVRNFRGYGFFSNGAAHPAVMRPEESGGWVIHHAIHGADWLSYIAGSVASVNAQMFSSSPHSPSSEGVFTQLQFCNGVVGHLADSVCGYREHSAGLLGTRGTATFGKDGVLRLMAEPTKPESGQEVTILADEEGYRHVATHHFISVIQGGCLPRATLHDGYKALNLCLAMIDSARQHKNIDISACC